MRRRGPLLSALVALALALSGCAIFPLGQPPVPPVTDETPVGTVHLPADGTTV